MYSSSLSRVRRIRVPRSLTCFLSCFCSARNVSNSSAICMAARSATFCVVAVLLAARISSILFVTNDANSSTYFDLASVRRVSRLPATSTLIDRPTGWDNHPVPGAVASECGVSGVTADRNHRSSDSSRPSQNWPGLAGRDAISREIERPYRLDRS